MGRVLQTHPAAPLSAENRWCGFWAMTTKSVETVHEPWRHG